MRAVFASLCLVIAVSGCSERACELCGRWQSNEELTLAEMARTDHLSPEQVEFFSNSFFGRLTVESRPGQAKAYFQDEDPAEVEWSPWEVVSRSGQVIVTRSRSADGAWSENTIELHGECYRTFIERVGFFEWFCRM